MLGPPSWQERCGAKFPYGSAEKCAVELGHRSAFVPVDPLWWVIQLDVRDRAIVSEQITSP